MPPQQYTLYHHPYSLCSIQVRYTLALAGEPVSDDAAMDVAEEVVDIMHSAQLDEPFLTKINPKGQVPVLTSPAFSGPLADSLDITNYIGGCYPQLFPDEQRRQIDVLMKKLHGINYFSLSFGDKPQVVASFDKGVNERLAREGIREEYRKALEYKLNVNNEQKLEGTTSKSISMNEQKAKALLAEMEPLVHHGKPWLFGLKHPTALDAHLIVFLARMRDVNRGDMVSPALGEYLDGAMQTKEWASVMQGRKTMIGV